MSDAGKKVWRLVFALILLTILIGISMMLPLNKPAVPSTMTVLGWLFFHAW